MASSLWTTVGVILESAKELGETVNGRDARAVTSSLVETIVAAQPDLARDASALGRLKLACESLVQLHLNAPLGPRASSSSSADDVAAMSAPLARGGFGGRIGGFGGGGGRIGGFGGGGMRPLPPVMRGGPVGGGGGPRGAVWRTSPAARIRTLTGPATLPRARVPAGYRFGRVGAVTPYRWAGSSMRPYRIGPMGGYIYRPYSGFRPWRSYGGFLGFLGLGLSSWLVYPWFRLWYYPYMLNPYGYSFYGPNPYYMMPRGPLAAGLPELGYVDFRTWTPEQIDLHIRELEAVYATTVAAGYRIVPDPATGRLYWVYNVNVPAQGMPVPSM
jgi:hypothetical protein